MSLKIFLITENTFHAGYLVTKWLEAFGGSPDFLGIALRENPIPAQNCKAKENFHQRYQGQTSLDGAAREQLQILYPALSETELAMITSFGIPAHSVTSDPRTLFLGKNINNPWAQQWLSTVCATPQKPFLFIFLDRILAPWWLELTGSQIINGHSAVLPYAKGTFAIEQVAISQDSEHFRASAGATIHYIDTGIDTGPIIRGERFRDPFRFDSIWDCKGHSFMLVFDLLIQVASEMSKRVTSLPLGTMPAPLLYSPTFKRADLTPERCREAEIGYLNMKIAHVRN